MTNESDLQLIDWWVGDGLLALDLFAQRHVSRAFTIEAREHLKTCRDNMPAEARKHFAAKRKRQ